MKLADILGSFTGLGLIQDSNDPTRDVSTASRYIASVPVARRVKTALEQKGLAIEQAKMEMVPATQVRLEDKRAEQMVRLMDAFEDHDDVQNVWANFDIDESEMGE